MSGESEKQRVGEGEASGWVQVQGHHSSKRREPVPISGPKRDHGREEGDRREIRARAKENFMKLEQTTFTVEQGQVVDAYLSRKQRRLCRARFAFVRYAYKNHAERAIREINNKVVSGRRIFVTASRFKRGVNGPNRDTQKAKEGKTESHKTNLMKVWRALPGQKSYSEALVTGTGQKETHDGSKLMYDGPMLGVVHGIVNADIVKKLEKALVGESAIPLNSKETIIKLHEDWDSLVEIKGLGSFKMVMIFDSVESKMEALRSQFLLNHFGEVREWNVGEANRSRKA
ncbi:hypothetical protein PIB30_052401 [Stylosanthes scabra]|uniref:RRM domain-containing protein n=1 Tax=Stylosanthes scabra TaxID=79078 RepID=A0ABU6YGG3_9FABA|nr:hypothetical protein [Stylosanthes scabra]